MARSARLAIWPEIFLRFATPIDPAGELVFGGPVILVVHLLGA